ncbi:hypothetical protein AB4380_03870 [Vibrio breoganii]
MTIVIDAVYDEATDLLKEMTKAGVNMELLRKMSQLCSDIYAIDALSYSDMDLSKGIKERIALKSGRRISEN